MLFSCLDRNKLAVPVAMTFVVVGLVMTVLSLVLPRMVAAHPGSDSLDFARGFLVGLGIVLEIAGVVSLSVAARARKLHGPQV